MQRLSDPTIELLRAALAASADGAADQVHLAAVMRQVGVEARRASMGPADLLALLHGILAEIPAVRDAGGPDRREAAVQRIVERCMTAYFTPER